MHQRIKAVYLKQLVKKGHVRSVNRRVIANSPPGSLHAVRAAGLHFLRNLNLLQDSVMASSDGRSRDLVSTIPGAGWDFGLDRHPYHEIESPLDRVIQFTTGA